MARTNLPLSTLTPNSSIAAPTGTAIDQANGMNVQIPTNTFPATPECDHLFLLATNSAAGSHIVTVRAGVGGGATPGAAFRAGLGDLAITVGASATRWIGPFDPARFLQVDGSVNVDFDAGTTGTIIAAIMPVRW